MQLVHLKKLFPESTASIYRNCLTWKGEVKPTPLSETYAVQLRYTLAKSPQIKVLKPELIPPEGKCLPHIYHGKRLCLYYPGIGDWRGDMLLLKTIVPWISEWLYCYEIWLATGEWCGGGIHPKRKSNELNTVSPPI